MEAPCSAAVKCVLQGIKQQFVGDQAEQNALVEIERDLIGGKVKREVAARRGVRAQQHFSQLTQMRREIKVRLPSLVVELFVKTSHGIDAIATLGKNVANSGISKLARLKPEQAGHDLQVVLDPVVNFRERNSL